jgi:hypothetical protein
LDRYLNNRPPILVELLDTPMIATDSGFNKGDNSYAIRQTFRHKDRGFHEVRFDLA